VREQASYSQTSNSICACAHQFGNCKYGQACEHIGKPLNCCLFYLQGKCNKGKNCDKIHIGQPKRRKPDQKQVSNIVVQTPAQVPRVNQSDEVERLRTKVEVMKAKEQICKEIASLKTEVAVLSVMAQDGFKHARERERTGNGKQGKTTV
jgi:hypothetical protein